MSFVRLKKRAEFLAVSRKKDVVHTPYFVVQYLTSPVVPSIVRVGFTVSKKVGGAVVRNRVRRRLKEVVRLFFKDHSSDESSFSLDLVLIGKKSAEHVPFHTLCENFKESWTSIVSKSQLCHGKEPVK